MKTLIAAAAALLATAPAAAADFTFSYTVFDGTVASGTIDATDYGNGFFAIDDVTGTRGTQPITGYDFFDPTPQSFTYANGAVSDVDFSYSVGATSYEVRWPGNGALYGTEFADPFGSTTSQLVTSFTLAPAAVGGGVPEPAAWALMLGGFAAAGSTLRRRRTPEAFAA